MATQRKKSVADEPSYIEMFWASVCYLNFILFAKITLWWRKNILKRADPGAPPGYAPLGDDYGAFFLESIYGRINECYNRPVVSKPGPWIQILDRTGFDYADDLE
jgi:hypothetical protein